MNKAPLYSLTLKRKTESQFGLTDLRPTKVAKILLFEDASCRITKTGSGFSIDVSENYRSLLVSPSIGDSYEDSESQIDSISLLKLANPKYGSRNKEEDTEKICSNASDCDCDDCPPLNPTSPSCIGQ